MNNSEIILQRSRISKELDALTDTQYAFMHRKASIYSGDEDQGMDLIQEALFRLWSGKRALPDGVPFVAVVINIVRSLASNNRKQEPYLDPIDPEELPCVKPEMEIQDDRILALIEHFKDERETKDVIEGLLEGYTRAELIDLLDLDPKRYDVVRKRIFRTLLRIGNR